MFVEISKKTSIFRIGFERPHDATDKVRTVLRSLCLLNSTGSGPARRNLYIVPNRDRLVLGILLWRCEAPCWLCCWGEMLYRIPECSWNGFKREIACSIRFDLRISFWVAATRSENSSMVVMTTTRPSAMVTWHCMRPDPWKPRNIVESASQDWEI